MFNKALYSTLSSAWPMIFIFCIVIITVRLSYLKINNKKIILYQEIFNLLFIIYIMLLYELVTNTEKGSSGLNLVPFTEITRYEFGSDLFIYNVLGNILVFMPFGFFVSNYVNAKTVSQIGIIGLITSFTIELVQYRIGRAFDIDDIILNVAGAVIGFLIYIALSAIQRHLPSLFKSDLFYNIILVLILIALATYFTRFVGFGWF